MPAKVPRRLFLHARDDADVVGPDGDARRVSVDQLVVGDVVLVASGGRIPAVGSVLNGSAEVDEAMISGESRPVAKIEGDRVVAGTVATDSALRVRVDPVG